MGAGRTRRRRNFPRVRRKKAELPQPVLCVQKSEFKLGASPPIPIGISVIRKFSHRELVDRQSRRDSGRKGVDILHRQYDLRKKEPLTRNTGFLF